jgi:predicted HD phosphohydrolase
MATMPTRMDEFTTPQWERVRARSGDSGQAAEAVLGLLRSLGRMVDGFPVDQLTHACQTATRAERAGAGPDMVVAALCHDVGKAISRSNHGAISAEILRPYVGDDVYHVVRTHQDFQLRHYGRHLGGDETARERHRGRPWFPAAERFADEWDQCSFDPDYDTCTLDHFEPLVRRVLALPRHPPG